MFVCVILPTDAIHWVRQLGQDCRTVVATQGPLRLFVAVLSLTRARAIICPSACTAKPVFIYRNGATHVRTGRHRPRMQL